MSTGAVYYVAPAGNDSRSGLTWATALKTISNGVAKASAGDTVMVSNGTYAIGVQISVTKDITVRSTNGAAVTTVQATPGWWTGPYYRCFYINSAGAVVEGFTLTGGSVVSPERGGAVNISAGRISRCIIRNSGNNSSGGGVQIYAGALVSECIIRNNTTEYGSGYGGGVRMDGGTLRSCLVMNNRSPYGGAVYLVHLTGGTVQNCTICDNTVTLASYPAGVWSQTGYGSVANSIIYNNYYGAIHTNLNYPGIYSYSCAKELKSGTGNMTNAPVFVDAGAGNYRHLTNSPCIDAGLYQTWMANATDLDGFPRVDWRTVDMGA